MERVLPFVAEAGVNFLWGNRVLGVGFWRGGELWAGGGVANFWGTGDYWGKLTPQPTKFDPKPS